VSLLVRRGWLRSAGETRQGEGGKWRRLPQYSASRSRLVAPSPPCFPCGFLGVLAGVFMGRRQVSWARTRSIQKQRPGAVASPGLITSLLFFVFSLFSSFLFSLPSFVLLCFLQRTPLLLELRKFLGKHKY
jgi:hypothetical protein